MNKCISMQLLKLPRKPNIEDLLRQFYYQSIATPTDDMRWGIKNTIILYLVSFPDPHIYTQISGNEHMRV